METAKNDQSERPNLAKAPKGLTYSVQPGRKQFQARWRDTGGRHAMGFETEEERAKFAVDWEKKRIKEGKASPIVTLRDATKWTIFKEMIGSADPIDVALFWKEHRTDFGGTMKLADAVTAFKALRKERNLSTSSEGHLNLHIDRLLAFTGDKRLCEIKADVVREWLAGLKHPDSGAPMEKWTLRDHLKSVKVLFSQAVVEQWIATNPIAAISPPKIEQEEVTVMSVDDVVKLFTANRDALCVGKLALEAFGGLRFSSAARLTGGEIHEKEKGIEMPGAKHKSGRRHYVDGYPPNLWAWIKHAHKACWDISPRQYLELKSKAFKDAEVVNPGNVLRHSFCSYHVALHKDAARTAVLLTHRSPTMLYQHYKGKATQADAKKYFAISPSGL